MTIQQVHAICRGCCFCAVDTPANAQIERLGMLPFTLLYRCRTCHRLRPWCDGAVDDLPDDCDWCWDAAHNPQPMLVEADHAR